MPPAPIVAIEQLFDECLVFFKTERLQSLSEFFYGDLGPFFPGRVETREQSEVVFFLRTQHYFDRTVSSYGYTATSSKRHKAAGFLFYWHSTVECLQALELDWSRAFNETNWTRKDYVS